MSYNDNKILITRDLEIGFPGSAGKARISLMKGISVKAGRGELVALIGRNGIGKSTLLRTLVQLQSALSGELILNKKRIEDYSRKELARQAGFVSTEIINNGNLCVYDLVALGRFPYTNWFGKISKKDRYLVDRSLELVGVGQLHDKMISEISDGERQRAMIARTLSQDTPLLILDEPMAFLDLPNRYEILKLLKELSGEEKTIIFSTHDLELVMDHVDKIWMMTEDGMLEGAPEDLVLNSSFNSVFRGSRLRFNNQSGRFDYPMERLHEVYVEGDGELKQWTIRALKRKGYLLADNKENVGIFIRVYRENGKICWQLKTGRDSSYHNSVYELMLEL